MDVWLKLAVPAALLPIMRVAWVWARRRLQKTPRDLELTASRAAGWLRRAGAFFVGRQLRRRWLRIYALEKYTTSLYETHKYLTIPGRGVTLPIDRCFIPLELRSGQVTEAAQIMTKRGAVLLLGDPGSGKSALLSRLVRTTCRAAIEDRDNARLPVYLPLNQIASLLGESDAYLTPADAFALLLDWFKKYELAARDLFDSDDLLSAFASQSKLGVCVFLDGLDELGTEVVAQVESFVISLIQYLSAAEGKNLVVVAARRQGLEFTPRLTSGGLPNLLTVELKPFTAAAIYSFLLRWPYSPATNATTEARRVFSQLRLNPTLFDACLNPLALALYVSNYIRLREEGGDVTGAPETRAGFFADVVDHLLVSRRVGRTGAKTPNRAFRLSRMNFFVSVVSDHIDKKEPFNTISNDVMMLHAALITKDGQAPEDALLEVARDSGIISRADSGTWRFIHRSFLDYFLACSLVDTSSKQKTDYLFNRLKADPFRYLEAFFLACGLMAVRSTPNMQKVLDQLGNNAFLGHYYPRASLEAQSYFAPNFVSIIKANCRRWKSDQSNVQLFRDLVAVLIDYEHACEDLGRTPEISVKGQLWSEAAGDKLSILQVAQLDVQIAMSLAGTQSLPSILLASDTEEAIVALYEPDVVDQLSDAEVSASPRLAAIVAEAALRSSLVSGHLAPAPQRNLALARHRLTNPVRWADNWAIRNSRFGAVLRIALPYIIDVDSLTRSQFPHLAILASAKPIRRLRNEIMLGDARLSALLISVITLLSGSVALAGVGMGGLIAATFASGIGTLLAFRWAVFKGYLTLPSSRILNLQPFDREYTPFETTRVRMVYGHRRDLHLFRFRRPVGSDGTVWAVYDRVFPSVWRRFCPALQDRRLTRLGCAAVQQMWTEEVRRLVEGN